MRAPWSALLLAVVAVACSDRTISAPTPSSSLVADKLGAPNDDADRGIVGGVFTETDDAAGNAVVAFARRADGTLRYIANYPTAGQGLAAKVFITPKASTRDTMNVAGDGWMDVKRTTDLWNNDFVGPKSVIRTNDWIDQPSVGIPYLYVATGLELSEALRSRGDNAMANEVWTTAKQVAKAVHLERIIGDQPPGAEQPALVPSESAEGVQLPVKPPPAAKAQDQAKPKAAKK